MRQDASRYGCERSREPGRWNPRFRAVFRRAIQCVSRWGRSAVRISIDREEPRRASIGKRRPFGRSTGETRGASRTLVIARTPPTSGIGCFSTCSANPRPGRVGRWAGSRLTATEVSEHRTACDVSGGQVDGRSALAGPVASTESDVSRARCRGRRFDGRALPARRGTGCSGRSSADRGSRAIEGGSAR